MEAKESNYKSVLKSNIIRFLSYGILVGFIFSIITILIKSTIADIYNSFLSITLSLICGIIIFHLLHFVCESSTIEIFRKYSINEDDNKTFLTKMNLFFLICIIVSIAICTGYLLIDSYTYTLAIRKAYESYSFISQDLAVSISNQIRLGYQNTFVSKVSSTIILELSFVVSFISLIPYEQKLIKKYNKSKKEQIL